VPRLRRTVASLLSRSPEFDVASVVDKMANWTGFSCQYHSTRAPCTKLPTKCNITNCPAVLSPAVQRPRLSTNPYQNKPRDWSTRTKLFKPEIHTKNKQTNSTAEAQRFHYNSQSVNAVRGIAVIRCAFTTSSMEEVPSTVNIPWRWSSFRPKRVGTKTNRSARKLDF
jgi:hypothetical protein